jgi:hypothetical protein
MTTVIHPLKLEMLYRVLDESLAEVLSARPAATPAIEMRIRVCLAEQILAALERGEVDPAKLKDVAVTSVATEAVG